MSDHWVIIDGSHRKGNTDLINQVAVNYLKCSLIKLKDYEIKHYSYKGEYEDDDFINLIHSIIKYDNIILTTPMYWYAMSGIMKVFLDRFTDLLKKHKDLGRQLRGKTLTLIYNSNGDQERYFETPFENTANYLGMKYLGALHINMENEEISEQIDFGIKSFLSSISQENK